MKSFLIDSKKYPDIAQSMSIKEVIDFEGFDKDYLYNEFKEYMKSIMYGYGLRSNEEYEKSLKEDFDKFYGKIHTYIVRNIKGIKDGSIRDENQFMLPKVKKK